MHATCPPPPCAARVKKAGGATACSKSANPGRGPIQGTSRWTAAVVAALSRRTSAVTALFLEPGGRPRLDFFIPSAIDFATDSIFSREYFYSSRAGPAPAADRRDAEFTDEPTT